MVQELPRVTEAFGAFCLSVPPVALSPGEVLGIFGRSGSGKSSYLRAVARQVPGIETQLLPQDDDTLPELTVEQNVWLGALSRESQPTPSVEDVLSTFDLTTYTGRTVARLSGGQRRRVAIARVLAANPSLLLLDEPFGGLGRHYESIVATELVRRSRSGLAAVIVSHDLQLLLAITRRILVFHEGAALETLVDGDPQGRWTRLLGEILGISNVLPVGVLRSLGTLVGADSLSNECIIMAWRNWASVDASSPLRLRFEFATDLVEYERAYSAEGASYLHVRLAGPNGPLDLTGVVSESRCSSAESRSVDFTEFIIADGTAQVPTRDR